MLIEISQEDGYSIALFGGTRGKYAAERLTRRLNTITNCPTNYFQDKSFLPKMVWCVQSLGLSGKAMMVVYSSAFDVLQSKPVGVR